MRKMTLNFWTLLLCVFVILPLAQQAAEAAQRDQNTVALFGAWTPIRFNRGQLDDVIPAEWELGFFEKEREGLNRALTRSFATMLADDLGYKVIPPSSYERISNNMYRKIYVSYNVEDLMSRYDWSQVDNFAKMLNVRYAMFADVTKCDVSDLNNVQLEITILVFDSETNAVVYAQPFASAGRMAQELPVSTLRRAHPKMDEQIISFLRNPLGRAALIVYDDFAGTLSGQADIDFSKTVQEVTVTDLPVVVPLPGAGLETEFASSVPCKPGGDALVVASLAHGSSLRILSCRADKFEIVQSKDSVYPGFAAGVWPVIGAFETRGQPLLALGHTVANDDMRVFPIKVDRFDFSAPAFQASDFFGGYDKGIFIAAGDFDGNGVQELIGSAAFDRNEIVIHEAIGGVLSLRQQLVSPVASYEAGLFPGTGDFDGDGVDELVLCHTVANDEARVYKASGGRIDPAQPMAVLINIFKEPYSGGCFATGGDLDGDGADELIVSKNAESGDVVVLKYIDGAFKEIDAQYPAVPNYGAGLTLATGDFDGDGVDELALGHTLANDEVRIIKFRNGKLDTANPITWIHDVFRGYSAGVLLTAGAVPQIVKQ